MEKKIIFEKDNFSLKNPKHLQKNVFIIYSSKAINIEPATHMKIDTEVTVFLPQNSKGFLTSIFRMDKINELFHGKHFLWVEILNKYFVDLVEIKRNQPLGFFVIEPENLKFLHEAPNKRRRDQTKRKYRRTGRKRKRETVGFLNRYDFAYAGRDTVNQVSKVAPGVIKAATNGINNIAQERINQIISQGGKEVERVLPEILRGKHH